ncbi:MAG: portal protein [bacterium]|nr:portal protein [bacterium]
MADTTTDRKLALQRLGQLKIERASWFQHWMELSAYFSPRQGRYFIQDRNKGYRRHNTIYDNTGTRSLGTLGAGLMGGLTSPARPWFRLSTGHPDMNKDHEVRRWLTDVTNLMLEVFQKSNAYRALHQVYKELGVFGTAACIIVPDFKNVIHLHPLTTGEYCISTNFNGRVDVLYREFQLTVGQMVKEFGRENCSTTVQAQYDRGALDTWVTVIHAIEPRADRDASKIDNQNMAWSDVYWELGGEPDKPLRTSGFKHFPALCPRWDVEGGDIYGNSPGMEALGDVKQLQHEQLRKAQGIDYMTKPPVQVPTSMKNRDVDMLPGGISYVDVTSAQGGIRSAFEVNLNLQYLLEDIQDVRNRIRSAFFADLFMMIANDVDTKKTATEVAELHEEKMLMLGPVLERLQDELLNPLIDITFTYMSEQGLLPPAPEQMHGMPLSIELVSMLAQAQRAISTNGIDRFVGALGAVSQYKPEVLDKFDGDAWADEYADVLGVSPNLLVATDKAKALRIQRQKAAAAAQQAATNNQRADTVQKLSSVPTQGGNSNAGADVLGMFSGYGQGQQ